MDKSWSERQRVVDSFNVVLLRGIIMNEIFDFIKNRVLAYIIDLFLVILFTALVRDLVYSFLIDVPLLDSSGTLFLSTIIGGITAPIAYFALFEMYLGTTIGKKLYILIVIDENDDEEGDDYKKVSLMSAFIRSLSKIRIELTILDFLVGVAISKTEQQRLLDILAKTRVIPGPDPGYARGEQKTINAFKLVFTLIALAFFSIWIFTTILSYLEFFRDFY